MWPQSLDDSAPPAPSHTNHNNIGASKLPAKAVIEGPSSYFRLLGIDQAGGGLRHEQFAALLMSATDNRMTLEDIHRVWGDHVKVQQQEEDGVAMAIDHHPSKEGWAPPRPRAGLLLLLPSFLHAFADLARAKYCHHTSSHNNDYGGGGPGVGDDGPRAVTHLLLRDVFNNIATRSALRSEKARYGVCAHLVREDVCSFLLSQRSFTAGLFVTYASDNGALTFRDGWGVDKGHNCVPPPSSSYACGKEGSGPVDSKWKLAVSRNSHMCWTDYLAVASDLQLTPRLVGVDVLKVVMEQVFSAPHRVQARGGLGDLSGEHSSDRNEETRQRSKMMGMTYPQFVESLSLLAIHAAERLRFLYPDIAGTDLNNARKRAPTPKADGESSSRAHSGARRNDRCSTADKHYSQRVPGVGSGKEARGRPGGLACNKAVRALPAVQLAPGTRDTSGGTPPRGAKSGEKELPVSSAVTRQAERSLPYDLGALKALFHHARISYKDNRSKVRIRSGTARSRYVGVSSQDKAEATVSEQPRGYGSSERVSSRAETFGVGRGLTGGVRGAVTARALRTGGHEGETVSDPTDRLARVYTPTDSARTLDAVVSRVSKLETENLPSEFNNMLEAQGANRQASAKLAPSGQARVEEHAKPLPPAVGTGGALARLVVIKELQLVPEFAPIDIRHLLELALDHHQAGRYDLALKILDKTGHTWRALQGGEGRSLPVAAEQDGKGVLNGGGGGTYIATSGVGIDDQVDGRRGNVRSEREAVHGGVERLGKVGGGSKWRLDGADEALLHLMEGSICQSAGRDDDALSTLLRAEEAVATIHRDQICLRGALATSVLSEMGVVLYYSRRTALSLRCFRLALILRRKLLQQQYSERQETPETETSAVPGRGGVTDGGTNPSPARGSAEPMPAVEAGEVAAAATLNNIGVCLAGEGDARLAVKSLGVSSKATTSALGIEHPRSAVIARNLALVRGAGRSCSDSIAISGFCLRQEAATGEPGVGRWEGDMRRLLSIGGRRGSSATDKADGDGRGGLASKRVGRSLHSLPGGFPVPGVLPRGSGDTARITDRGGGVRKKRAGGKKKVGKVGSSPRMKRG